MYCYEMSTNGLAQLFSLKLIGIAGTSAENKFFALLNQNADFGNAHAID